MGDNMRLTEVMTIVRNDEIAEDIFDLVITGENTKIMNQPGQFVNIKVNEVSEPILRRPISICEIDKANNKFRMIYRTEGKGTKLLSQKQKGDKIDILGPLGTGFPEFDVKENETALLVGGGIGVPPLYELAKRLHKKGIKVVTVLGFAGKKNVFFEEEFRSHSEVYVATVDGSYGSKGYVTDIIENNNIDFDVIYACGPTPMLKALDLKYKSDKRGYLSFEERMACGIGACYACVCKTNNGGYSRVCKEGPVFSLGEVKYDE